jgi:glycosyltransferase involved in cell wall biosynthesis
MEMKILLSAYACEPNMGSEPGVGWQWAQALRRRGFEVHVITRSNNRKSIERAYNGLDELLTFHYFDLPGWLRFWKKWPGGIYLYYLLWQIGAYRLAKGLHSTERFNCVQHITFVSYRQPSFMGSLGIPFIFGPVGGGESMPEQFRRSLPMSARLSEATRSAGNALVRFDPLMRRTFAQARTIVCATEETRMAIPLRFRDKCVVQRAIGIDDENLQSTDSFSPASKPRFLFVGRLLYWKGLQLLLRALAIVKEKIPDVSLRVIGEGSERAWLEQVAQVARVSNLVQWIPRKPHDEIRKEYRDSTGFVFPSLHDSGGMVVLEALGAGLPVVCLDIGGPGSIVTSESGFSLSVRGQSEAEVVQQIAAAMVRLVRDGELRRRLSEGAVRRAMDLSWDAAAEGVYGPRSGAASIGNSAQG